MPPPTGTQFGAYSLTEGHTSPAWPLLTHIYKWAWMPLFPGSGCTTQARLPRPSGWVQRDLDPLGESAGLLRALVYAVHELKVLGTPGHGSPA